MVVALSGLLGAPAALDETPVAPVPANAPMEAETVAPGSLWSETQSRVLVGMDSNARRSDVWVKFRAAINL